MGAKMSKGEGLLSPAELVVRQHPVYVKQIRHCMKKWHKKHQESYNGRRGGPLTQPVTEKWKLTSNTTKPKIQAIAEKESEPENERC